MSEVVSKQDKQAQGSGEVVGAKGHVTSKNDSSSLLVGKVVSTHAE